MTRRLEAMQENLISGRTVKMTALGDSLSPLIINGDTCIWHPIIPGISDTIEAGEVVFCLAPDFHRRILCCRLVLRTYTVLTKYGTKKAAYIIGNAKQGESKTVVTGVCFHEDIYGILVKTTPRGT